MKRLAGMILLCGLAAPLFGGFKPKTIRPKKPEQYQVRATAAGVTIAADLLLDPKDQKEFFYKELTGANLIALRLALFNKSGGEVELPLESLSLTGPDGKELALVEPEAVAHAIFEGVPVAPARKQDEGGLVSVQPGMRTGDPRTDRTDPNYDPRLDPTDPSYDPNDPRHRRYGGRPGYGPYSRPGIDVILNPTGGGGGGGDSSRFERELVVKDFSDKAHHSLHALVAGMVRDRFLYYTLKDAPANARGFVLRLPRSRGIQEEIVLKF